MSQIALMFWSLHFRIVGFLSNPIILCFVCLKTWFWTGPTSFTKGGRTTTQKRLKQLPARSWLSCAVSQLPSPSASPTLQKLNLSPISSASSDTSSLKENWQVMQWLLCKAQTNHKSTRIQLQNNFWKVKEKKKPFSLYRKHHHFKSFLEPLFVMYSNLQVKKWPHYPHRGPSESLFQSKHLWKLARILRARTVNAHGLGKQSQDRFHHCIFKREAEGARGQQCSVRKGIWLSKIFSITGVRSSRAKRLLSPWQR